MTGAEARDPEVLAAAAVDAELATHDDNRDEYDADA